MKKSELKQVLKPLIKQCIKEVIFEEGILSGIITEVVGGLTHQTQDNQIVESKASPEPFTRSSHKEETRKRLAEAISKDAYNGVNIFENIEPLSTKGSPSKSPSASSPLSTYAPNDPGVNIDGILSVAKNNWAKLL